MEKKKAFGAKTKQRKMKRMCIFEERTIVVKLFQVYNLITVNLTSPEKIKITNGQTLDASWSLITCFIILPVVINASDRCIDSLKTETND